MHDLTKASVPFVWTPSCQAAFEGVKHSLTSAPVLALPDFTKPFELIADASLDGIGAVLQQEGRPLAYHSRKLSSAERNYTTGEQELLAVHDALQVWRCYLEGSEVTLVTDHNPNTFLNTQALLSRRQARWMEFLARFKYKWLYRPGRSNVADPISRNPTLHRPSAQCSAIRSPQSDLNEEIMKGYRKDDWYLDPTNTAGLTRSRGLWFKGGRVAVPCLRPLILRILNDHHDSPWAGHPGRDRTLDLVERHFWWPTLRADVERYVAHCDKCQRSKPRGGRVPGTLQPLPIPHDPWESVTVDFVTGLPRTLHGYDAICVFVDRLTKMTHFVPCKKAITAEETAELFLQHVVRLHGEPATLISDRGPQFAGHFMHGYLRRLGTQSRLSTAYHPQTDGQTERMNRVLEEMLRSFVSPNLKNWDTLLPLAEFAVNNAKQASTGHSPFYLNYGRHPATPFYRDLKLTTDIPVATERAEVIRTALKHAQVAIEAAQQRQAATYDVGKVDQNFNPGQQVLLNTKNLRSGPHQKLLPRWLGPFTVIEHVGRNAVRLEIPPHMAIHPVFHVSLLRAYKSDGSVQPPSVEVPEVLINPTEPEVLPYIVAERKEVHYRKLRNKNKRYEKLFYRVRYPGFSEVHDQWLPSDRVPAESVSKYRSLGPPGTSELRGGDL
ncbi:RNase H-like domain-containing protein [Bosea sp. (in: a-proteobacteria)]|uniref:RNase H-like domain-containing protein n=2 Tax=Bosea sp. (in: a-proteobacteria) TaxID=1871050 RepID=UPI004033B5A2